MAISKVELLDETGVTAGSYLLTNLTIGADGRITAASNGAVAPSGVVAGSYTNPSITVAADGRLTAATENESIVLTGATATSGDFISSGGADGLVGIYNSSSTSVTNRAISLTLKNDSGNYSTWLAVGRDAGSGAFTVDAATNFRAAEGTFHVTNSDGLNVWGDKGDIIVTGGVDGTGGLFLKSGAADRNYGFYTYNDYGNIFPPLSLGRSSSTGRFYVAVNSASPSLGCDLFVNAGNLNVNGAKNFRIDHPLDETKHLIHTSVEAPRADLIYRGTVQLTGGTASVVLDEEYGLIPGTWEALCRNPQVWVTSVDGWELCKGSVTDGVLTIQAKDPACTETVSWLVVAERQDAVMYTDGHDENGRPILEPEKVDMNTAPLSLETDRVAG